MRNIQSTIQESLGGAPGSGTGPHQANGGAVPHTQAAVGASAGAGVSQHGAGTAVLPQKQNVGLEEAAVGSSGGGGDGALGLMSLRMQRLEEWMQAQDARQRDGDARHAESLRLLSLVQQRQVCESTQRERGRVSERERERERD